MDSSRFIRRTSPWVVAFLVPLCAAAEDRQIGSGSLEPMFKVPESIPKGITEEQLRGMSLSDPRLRVAYFWLSRGAYSGVEADVRHAEVLAVLRDVKRRGDSTTPLWIDIMEKNQETELEYAVPLLLGTFKTIKMEPYVDYFRRMIQTRGDSTNGTLFEVALETFFEFGSKEDVQLALDLAEKRPFLRPYTRAPIETELRKHRYANRRSGQETSPAQDPADHPADPADKAAPEPAVATSKPAPVALQPEIPASSTRQRWLGALGLGVLALAGFVARRFRRKAPDG